MRFFGVSFCGKIFKNIGREFWEVLRGIIWVEGNLILKILNFESGKLETLLASCVGKGANPWKKLRK